MNTPSLKISRQNQYPDTLLAKTESRFPSLWPFIIPPVKAIKARACAQQMPTDVDLQTGWTMVQLTQGVVAHT